MAANKSEFSQLGGIILKGEYQHFKTPNHKICGSACDMHGAACQAYSYRLSTKECTLSSSFEPTGEDLRFHLTKKDIGYFIKVKDVNSQISPKKEDCIDEAKYDDMLEKQGEKWLKGNTDQEVVGSTEKMLGESGSGTGASTVTSESKVDEGKVDEGKEDEGQKESGNNSTIGSLTSTATTSSTNGYYSDAGGDYKEDTETESFATTSVVTGDGKDRGQAESGGTTQESQSTEQGETGTTTSDEDKMETSQSTTIGLEISSSPSPALHEVTPKMKNSTPEGKEECLGTLGLIKSSIRPTFMRFDKDAVNMASSSSDSFNTWCIEEGQDGKVVIKNMGAGLYLNADNSGVVHLSDKEQTWGMAVYSDGGRAFKSVYAWYLMGAEEGRVNTVKKRSPETTFFIENL